LEFNGKSISFASGSMKRMIEILNTYLAQHKSINIPGLGTIYVERVPARTDFVNQQLLPPIYTYRFDKYFDAPDKDFFAYLSASHNVPDYEAIRLYNEFAFDFRSNIGHEQPAEWKDVGRFYRDDAGEIAFEPDEAVQKIWSPVPAERVIRTNQQHAMLVGDREMTTSEMSARLQEDVFVEKEPWWIYALIIAAVSLSLIFYHYYAERNRSNFSGNGQHLPYAAPHKY
jgi:CCDC81-like prokaryotic HU domain 1